ncbi:cytochrome P450 [Mycena olivaceomarginata]|nr:cytochrome P450 [Mycena olivaceomarginata]
MPPSSLDPGENSSAENLEVKQARLVSAARSWTLRTICAPFRELMPAPPDPAQVVSGTHACAPPTSVPSRSSVPPRTLHVAPPARPSPSPAPPKRKRARPLPRTNHVHPRGRGAQRAQRVLDVDGRAPGLGAPRRAAPRAVVRARAAGQDVKHLAGIAIVAVARRLGRPTDRVDLLSKLQAGKDDGGELMGRAELTVTLLIAGSDTTSNSTCAIIHHLANPSTQATLQAELDEQLGTEDELVANAEQVKRLPYLDACINRGAADTLDVGAGAAEGGLIIGDRVFPVGAVLSVPSYSIHRDPAMWGADVEAFRPEQWLGPAAGEAEWEARRDAMQRAFNPFSVGPRACVGRNLASLELQIIVASIMRRYHFVLERPEQELQTREGFLRKPLRCDVGIQRRDV